MSFVFSTFSDRICPYAQIPAVFCIIIDLNSKEKIWNSLSTVGINWLICIVFFRQIDKSIIDTVFLFDHSRTDGCIENCSYWFELFSSTNWRNEKYLMLVAIVMWFFNSFLISFSFFYNSYRNREVCFIFANIILIIIIIIIMTKDNVSWFHWLLNRSYWINRNSVRVCRWRCMKISEWMNQRNLSR